MGYQLGDAGEPGWGSRGLTVVGAVYCGATFSARVQVQDVPEALREMNKILRGYRAHRTAYLDAKDSVVNMLLRNDHLTEDGGYTLANTLLWCFCVGSPGADLLREMACQGGHMLIYEITGKVPGMVNFRVIAGRADDHPLAHLFPDPRDIQTAGRA
jgi:hypothetical protein